jgi:hypothetical protein
MLFEYIKWSNSIYESVMVGFRYDFSVVILHKYILKNQVARRYPSIKSKVSMKALFRSKKIFYIVLKRKTSGFVAVKSDAEFAQVRKLFTKNGIL